MKQVIFSFEELLVLMFSLMFLFTVGTYFISMFFTRMQARYEERKLERLLNRRTRVLRRHN